MTITEAPEPPPYITTPSEPLATRRHEEYYFEDGNLVIQVSGILFRLWGGSFRRHSKAFPVPLLDKAANDDEHPLVLEGVDSADFERLLWIVDPPVLGEPPSYAPVGAGLVLTGLILILGTDATSPLTARLSSLSRQQAFVGCEGTPLLRSTVRAFGYTPVALSCSLSGGSREVVTGVIGRENTLALTTAPADPPLFPASELHGIVGTDVRQAFDMRDVIARVVDGGRFRKFKQEYGTTMITGFAPVHGYRVGIVANNGILFSPSALKATHFIQLCSQRGIPLLFLVNVTGYLVGSKAERGGIAKDGAKMVRAVACADVSKLTVVVGGSFGAGSYGAFLSVCCMAGRAYSPRYLWMWPNAKISVMGSAQLSQVMTAVSKDPSQHSSLQSEIAHQSTALYSTARLWDDGIIRPTDTRDVVGLALGLAARTKAGGDAAGSRGIGTTFGVFRM
ncbi:ClpP/crotonase-like domain-containing protein [Mycena metata]|uniref:ClpP/crotonase-like domain-containing protein n=1 Tax=Mycena metata TaxID=1033252 RepID=A0AAD7K9Y3_9AGAR|nr:ClpP/crotonase-like domain-containing protein [Mycena metata]